MSEQEQAKCPSCNHSLEIDGADHAYFVCPATRGGCGEMHDRVPSLLNRIAELERENETLRHSAQVRIDQTPGRNLTPTEGEYVMADPVLIVTEINPALIDDVERLRTALLAERKAFHVLDELLRMTALDFIRQMLGDSESTEQRWM